MNNKEKYRAWCVDKEKNLPLFLQPWYLDAVCLADWDIALHYNKDNKLIGVLPFYLFKKKMLSVIGMPFLTPYMGLYLDFPSKQKLSTAYDFEKEVATGLLLQIPSSHYLQQKFYPEYIYGLPFFWNGFRLDWRYTYHLSLRQTVDNVWENMEGSARTQLLKTQKIVSVEISEDQESLYQLVEMTFGKQNLKVPYTRTEFSRLYQATKAKDAGHIYIARLKETGKAIAGMFMVKDKTKVYNLVLGRDHHLDPGGSIHGILWQCIQDHIDQHDIFDFEGSMLEGPERMFRSFGSTRIPVLQVTRYKNRLWKAVLALAGK